jgi:hypothetical protein
VTFELVISEEKTFNQDPRIVHGGHVSKALMQYRKELNMPNSK